MKRFTKFSSLILSLIFAFSIALGVVFTAGCSKDNDTPPPTTEEPPADTPPAEELPPVTEDPEPEVEEIKIGISGRTEVHSEQSVDLKAAVSGTEDTSVTWAVTDGGEYATIDANGRLTAKKVEDDKIIKVTATSKADPSVKAEKTVIVTSERVLTQDMLDVLNGLDEIAFEGYIDIDLYTIGAHERFYQTYNLPVKTAMDGTNWYAEYDNSSTGTTMALYYRNHDNVACQVGVSLLNEEEYSPMLDSKDNKVSWTDSGLYNNFKGLTEADFEFDTVTWLNKYVGTAETFMERAVASANPYDFIPESLYLIVEHGEIIGFRCVSKPDYTITSGYKAIQTMTVALNYGETVKVPAISKYEHAEVHDKLAEAIGNMQSLESYTLDYTSLVYSALVMDYTNESFRERVTEDICYFEPYVTYLDEYGNERRRYTGDNYGYKKLTEDLYNTFSLYRSEEDGSRYYAANRAYAADFSKAKPSFAFAAEIFTAYYEDPDDGTTTYYVDAPMCPVASTFYYGIGNDIALYGIFAAEYTSTSVSFTPYVVVKDGYVIESGFYFYLGYLYGVVEIHYSGFDTTTFDAGQIEFETREVPASWSDPNLKIIVSDTDISGTEEDEEVAADICLKEFFGEDVEIPFFGEPLGDTYGFGMTTYHFDSANRNRPAIMFYYDVPLDTDYSISSSLEKLYDYLRGLGFEKNEYGEFTNGEIVVAPVDSDLDLMIYVWKVPEA